MAWTGSALCNSWKKEIFAGVHIHKASGGDTIKAALYNNSASFTKNTTVYTTTNELATAAGYTAGGATVSNADAVLSGDTAYIDFGDALWTGSNTFTAYGSLLYNSTRSNKAILVVDFGGSKIAIGGTFTIQWPAPAAGTAIIRLT